MYNAFPTWISPYFAKMTGMFLRFVFFLECKERELMQVRRLAQYPTNGRKEIQVTSIPVLEGNRKTEDSAVVSD